MEQWIRLGEMILLPVIAAMGFAALQTYTAFGRKKLIGQGAAGIVFGLIAVFCTECGIPMNGAQINCRDGAVLIAGLLFGAPAGITAGMIGGVERWFSALWGIGVYTREACSISTLAAGFYAALLRKYLFEDKRPSALVGAAAGVVMEVFHMMMVFLTHMDEPAEAMRVVSSATGLMVLSNGVSVLLGSLMIPLVTGEVRGRRGERSGVRISQLIQRWLLVTVAMAFTATSVFMFSLQNRIAISQEERLLSNALDETQADIVQASDAELLAAAKGIRTELHKGADPETLADAYDVDVLVFAGADGRVTGGTDPARAGTFISLPDAGGTVWEYGYTEPGRKFAAVPDGDGYILVGRSAEQIRKRVLSSISGITMNRHVGQNGYILICDDELNVVSAPPGILNDEFAASFTGVAVPGEDTTFTVTLFGDVCSLQYRSVESYTVTTVMPEDDVMQTRNSVLYANTFLQVMVYAVMFALIYLLIRRTVVDRIAEVNDSLAKITAGDLDTVVDVGVSEELASLSKGINGTVDTLKRYIAEAKTRIDTELEYAKAIQDSVLPDVNGVLAGRTDVDVSVCMDPAKEVGGDFYDLYRTDADTLHFAVADVSGKGIPAAMFMMRAKTELRGMTEIGMTPEDVFTGSNRALCEGNEANMFVTAWQGRLDLKTGLVRYVNAGHNPPLIRRAGGRFVYLRDRGGIVLGGMEGMRYRSHELHLEPGDILFLYTDGVTEATNAQNGFYGEQRLLDTVNAKEYADMSELCAAVRADVAGFVGDAPQFDDITMLALRYRGTGMYGSVCFEKATIDDIPKATDYVDAKLEEMGCSMRETVQINVAIDEIFSNIVRHGYGNTPGPVTVSVFRTEEPGAVCVCFGDEAPQYDPLAAAEPDTALSAEERDIGGLGIFLVKKTMDDVRYRYEGGRNLLTVIKYLRG